MVDYQEMYFDLFRQVTKAITLLQEAQKKTEDAYTNACETEIRAFARKLEEDTLHK